MGPWTHHLHLLVSITPSASMRGLNQMVPTVPFSARIINHCLFLILIKWKRGHLHSTGAVFRGTSINSKLGTTEIMWYFLHIWDSKSERSERGGSPFGAGHRTSAPSSPWERNWAWKKRMCFHCRLQSGSMWLVWSCTFCSWRQWAPQDNSSCSSAY